MEDERDVDVSSNCSPHKSELPSHGDSSLSPWLGPSRDRDEKDGFSPSEVEFFKEQISTMDKSMKDYITNPDVTQAERNEI